MTSRIPRTVSRIPRTTSLTRFFLVVTWEENKGFVFPCECDFAALPSQILNEPDSKAYDSFEKATKAKEEHPDYETRILEVIIPYKLDRNPKFGISMPEL